MANFLVGLLNAVQAIEIYRSKIIIDYLYVSLWVLKTQYSKKLILNWKDIYEKPNRPLWKGPMFCARSVWVHGLSILGLGIMRNATEPGKHFQCECFKNEPFPASCFVFSTRSIVDSPGLVAMVVHSCSKGREFKSHHHILDGHFFIWILWKIHNVCLKKTKNKLIRGRTCPI